MLRYLKAAFWASLPVPGLGSVPVNALAAAAFAILGFGHPGFWLLGLGLEAAFLAALATNPRFQKLVDARAGRQSQPGEGMEQLAAQLPPAQKNRYVALANECRRALDVYRSSGAERYLLETNSQALDRLQWTFLKLLISQYHLEDAERQTSASSLKREIDALEKELADRTLSDALRQSKQATLAIARQRLANQLRRIQTLEEIEGDLRRIEAQVKLARENASMDRLTETIPADIELATDLLTFGDYGELREAVTGLDTQYGQRSGGTEAAQ